MKLETPNTENVFYLYAILPILSCKSVQGILDDEIDVIQGRAFGAVVRRCDGALFTGCDRQALTRQLLAQQQLVEVIMGITPILPVKFGTNAPDRESVERCLASGEVEFSEAFERTSGKVQFEIQTHWNLEDVLAKISRSPELASLKSAGAEPVEVGKAVKSLLEKERSELSSCLSSHLRSVAADSVDNALVDDRMVLNTSLLIDRKKTEELDSCLETIDAAHNDRLNFRCVGPMPPYNFATVEVSFLDPEKVSWARKFLGLDEEAYLEEIRAVYHRLARQKHPDTALPSADDSEMTALLDAYQTLCAFTKSGGLVQVSVCRQ